MSEATTDERVLQALDRISARLDALEARVGASTALTDPRAEAMGRLLDRIDTIEAALDTVDRLGRERAALEEGAGATVGALMGAARDRGIDPVVAGLRGLEIAAKAMQPASMDLVDKALDQAELAHFALDTGARTHAHLKASGADLDALSEQAAKANARLAAVLASPKFDALLGMLDEANLSMGASASAALAETHGADLKPPGLFGMLAAMRDPDIQRFMAFGMAFAKRMGAALP